MSKMIAVSLVSLSIFNGFSSALAQDPVDNRKPKQINQSQINDLDSILSDPSIPKENPQRIDDDYVIVFKGFTRAIISSQVTTTVQHISYRMGESFHKGDLLLQLDDIVYVALREKALGALAKAEADLTAKEQLFQEHISSQFEVKTAQAEVASAHADIIGAEHSIRACHVLAPYDGKVVNLFVEEYELIQEGKPLIEIVNDKALIGQILAPASIFSKIALSQEVNIHIKEINENLVAKIYRIDAVIDPASSLFKIDLLVDNTAGKLRPGMTGLTNLKEVDRYSPNQPEPAHLPSNF